MDLRGAKVCAPKGLSVRIEIKREPAVFSGSVIGGLDLVPRRIQPNNDTRISHQYTATRQNSEGVCGTTWKCGQIEIRQLLLTAEIESKDADSL